MEKVVNHILADRISTTDVADAMGKKGLLSTAKPVVPGLHCAGPGAFIYACGHSNWQIHHLARAVQPGSVVYVAVYDCGDKAVLGDLVVQYLVEKRKVAGVVVDGNVRDAHCLIEKKYPVWCRGFSPIGVGHDYADVDGEDRSHMERTMDRINKSVLVCDDSGVVIVEEFSNVLSRITAIQQREVDWHRWLEEGQDTFDFVCAG